MSTSSKSLPTLIRLHQFQLDEKRRKLAELHDLVSNLGASLRQLEEELARESAIAQQSEGASYTFATYKKAIAERRVTLLESINQVDTEILDLTNEMKELFQDLKRFELTHAERQQQKAYKKERTEDGLRDEQALVRYRRGEGNA
ncbi:MAG: hypothetical protein ACK48E_07620 [Holosporales bacterium]|jgi:flagellar FliJ protein